MNSSTEGANSHKRSGFPTEDTALHYAVWRAIATRCTEGASGQRALGTNLSGIKDRGSGNRR